MYEIVALKSLPITIPIQMKSNQYSLSHLPFDPTQNSPPSVWKARLNKRIGETQLKKISYVK